MRSFRKTVFRSTACSCLLFVLTADFLPGAQIEELGEVPKNRQDIIISPDGSQIAMIGKSGSRSVAIINGQTGPKYDEIVIPQALPSNKGYISSSMIPKVQFSPDGKHTVYIGRRGAQHFLIRDGEASPPHDRVYLGEFSKDSGTYVYVAVNKEADAESGEPQAVARVYVNGKAGPSVKVRNHVSREIASLLVSADGKTVAYLLTEGKEPPRLIVNGKAVEPDKPVMNAPTNLILMSEDGKTVARVVGIPDPERPKYWAGSAVSVNGEVGPTFKAIHHLQFIKGTGEVTYVAVDAEEKTVLVRGGKVTPLKGIDANRNPNSILFSPDGRSVALIRNIHDTGMPGSVVEFNGQSGFEYQYVRNLVFSPDGKTIAYMGQQQGEHYPVIGGEEGEAIKGAGQFVFSPDGERIAMVHNNMLSGMWDRKGKPVDLPGGTQPRNFTFAPVGHRFAYTDRIDNQFVVVIDGKPLHPVAGGMPVIAFSKDGKVVSWVGQEYVDGRPGSELFMNGKGMGALQLRYSQGPLLSADGRHAAYIAYDGGNKVVLNGKAGPAFKEVYTESYGRPNTLLFKPDGGLRYYAVQDTTLVRVTMKPEGAAVVPQEAIQPADTAKPGPAKPAPVDLIPKQGSAFQPGDLVKVEWSGQWYNATVREAKPDSWLISYEGYGSNWDEWVGPERIMAR